MTGPTRFRARAIVACLAFVGGLVVSVIGAVPASAVVPDPGSSGPLAVTVQSYDFGDTAFTPTGFPGPVEVRGRVHRPTNLSGGPFPLVLVLHGRHSTCYSGGSSFLEWPCTGDRQPIPSHHGYDYMSNVLASHGYVVASISANGINARDNGVTDLGADARARLLQHHLGRWQTWNSPGGGAPFGTTFVGKVDLQNVGTMGHSRGGEGVVRHYLHNQSLGSPFGIQSVIPLAPVDFNRPVINNVPFNVILPYCDGDVSDLQGMHFFDDALYNVPGDLAPKFTTLARGANHNFFNTIWTPGMFSAGTSDDWGFVAGGSGDPHCGTGAGNGRLTSAEQRAVGTAYMAGFFRYTLGGETALEPLFTGVAPPPASVGDADLAVGYHAPDAADRRLDVNRWVDSTDLTTNDTGGAVTQVGLNPYDMCGGLSPQSQHCSADSTQRQPHTVPSARSSKRGLPQNRIGWITPVANLRQDLGTSGLNVSGFDYLQFRVAVNQTDTKNPLGQPQNFDVVVGDGTGATATVTMATETDALRYPPGTVGPVPKLMLNMARLPLASFAGVDLADLRFVRFDFDRVNSGALLLNSLAFTNDPTVATPPPPTCQGLPATIVGTPGADVLAGTPAIDVIVGLGGADTIDGGASADVICGNEGDDRLLGGSGDDVLVGNTENDTLLGGTGDDDLQGSAGSDTASFEQSAAAVQADLNAGTAAGDGADVLGSIEHLVGSPLGDTLAGNGQDNSLAGGAGKDLLIGDSGVDTLLGEGGPDELRGGPGADQLSGGRNNDILRGDEDNDTLDGDEDVDTVLFTTATAAVTVDLSIGTAVGDGVDTVIDVEDVVGSQFDDTITGNAVANLVQGRGGNDDVSGAGGDDELRGNGGDDVLRGGDGNDVLKGGNGADELSGDAGDDTLAGESGAPDSCDGGADTDTDGGGCEATVGIP